MATIEQTWVERALGRPERDIPLADALTSLAKQRVLVTGAAGSLGTTLVPLLELAGAVVLATDIDEMDVREAAQVHDTTSWFHPDVIFHLAGAKHAPEGEEDPIEVCRVNAFGTGNLARYAGSAKLVLASTCKACDPETAYGSSKLIAERRVLNGKGTVARFYNVVDTQGNVFETWDSLEPDVALPVAPCSRFFVSAHEATALLIWSALLPAGRYILDAGPARAISTVARDLYPDRPTRAVAPRRGDRLVEPLTARAEWIRPTHVPYVLRVEGAHDPR